MALLCPADGPWNFDRFAGARALAEAADLKLEVWDGRSEQGAVGDVVVVASGYAGGDQSATRALVHRAETGGTVIILSDPDAPSNRLIDSIVPATIGPEVLASTDDPIVGDRTVGGQGVAGDRARQLQLEGVREVRGGHPVALAAGAVVGVEFPFGEGKVVVLGDGDIFTDAQIGRAENASFFVDLVARRSSGVDPDAILASLPFVCDTEAWTDIRTVDMAPWSDQMGAVAERVAAQHPDLTVEPAIVELKSEVSVLGAIALKAIAEFRGDGPRPAALRFTHVPFGDPGPTPDKAGAPKSGYNVALALLMATANGEPVGYRQESGGALLQEILPTLSEALRQTSLSSAVELLLHIETAFHVTRPEAVALHCLRGDPHGEAQTIVSSVPRALGDLTLADITVLAEPRFRTSADESFTGRRGRPGQRLSRPFAVLAGSIYDPLVTFDLDLLTAVDPRAVRALDNLNQAVLARHAEVVLEAGTVLVVGNRHAVHGRTPFRATFDGRDRWLLRTMLAGQLPSTEFRTGRIIETRYL